MQPNAVWDEVFSNGSWGRYPGEDLIRFIARNFYSTPHRAGITIAEVGCGPGANLWYLAREGFSIIGVDGSAVAIEQAKSRLNAEVAGWKGRLVVGDAQSLPIPDGSVDAVIDNECVYCNGWEESTAIYREIARVLRPQGLLFARTFAAGCWGEGTGEKVGVNSWRCTAGPLAGKGLSRFTHQDEIQALLGSLKTIHIELAIRTYENRTQAVREWIIHAVKES